MDYTNEQIEKKYAALPDDIREAMSSINIAQSVENIGKSHSLHVDQIGQLMDEVSFIMLGLMHPSDFISNIQKSINIDSTKAQEITKDINERIFRPIKSSLLSIHGVKQPEEKTESTQEETPKKEDVLKEIESPVRTNGSEEPVSNMADNEPPKEHIQINKLPEIKTNGGGEIKTMETSKDIVEEKLGGEFKIPSTEKEVAETANTSENKPVDPYREPIE